MWPPRRNALRRSPTSSQHCSLQLAATKDHASGDLLQRGRPTGRRRELAAVLRTGLGRIARSKAIEHLAEAFLGQILIGVLADQYHRRVHAGTEALHLFPAEIAVLVQMEGLVMDAVLADVDQILGAAQAARRGAADLDVSLLADRGQLEHRVE